MVPAKKRPRTLTDSYRGVIRHRVGHMQTVGHDDATAADPPPPHGPRRGRATHGEFEAPVEVELFYLVDVGVARCASTWLLAKSWRYSARTSALGNKSPERLVIGGTSGRPMRLFQS